MAAVDGLVSGMDTTTVIQQLLDLERMPQARLVQKQKAYESKLIAYQTVNAKLLSLQTASDALTKAETWQAFKVTSSASSVSATASSSALSGSLTFEVLSTAKAHAELGDHVFNSTAEQAATAGSLLTITKDDGTTMEVDTGDGSLAAVVANINAKGGGVRAAAMQVAPGEFRLSLSSTTTGEGSRFDVTGLTHTTGDLVVGEDAWLGVGTPDPGPPVSYAIKINSATNTFTDVLPGVTFTVSKAESVTLNVAADSSGIAGKVQAMVSAANAALDEIAKQTAFNPASNSKSALTGDATVRSIQQRILGMSSGLGNTTLADVGVQLTKGGRFEFTAATFEEAYKADPAGTAARFRPGGSMAPGDPAGVALSFAGDQTVAGSYDVEVTRAAQQAVVRVGGTVTDGDTFTVRVAGKDPITVTAASDTLDTLRGKINVALAGKGLGVVAAFEGGELVIRSAGYGSAASFALDVDSATAVPRSSVARLSGAIAGTEEITVRVAGFADLQVSALAGDNIGALASRINTALDGAGSGLTAVVRNNAVLIEGVGGSTVEFELEVTGGTLAGYVGGVDVEGKIGGITATGTGQVLAAPANDKTLQGLSFSVTSAVPMTGRFTYSPGFAQRLDSLAGDAIRTDTGLLSTVIAGGQKTIDGMQDQIESWDQRLVTRERMLRRQFANLETTLGSLRNQSNWLSGQLAGIAANNG